jgi:hypothetical protein
MRKRNKNEIQYKFYGVRLSIATADAAACRCSEKRHYFSI